MRGCWGNGEYVCVAIPNSDIRGGLGWVGVGRKRRGKRGRGGGREDLGVFNSAVHDLLKLTYANILAMAVE
jgi:hypothetical protein